MRRSLLFSSKWKRLNAGILLIAIFLFIYLQTSSSSILPRYFGENLIPRTFLLKFATQRKLFSQRVIHPEIVFKWPPQRLLLSHPPDNHRHRHHQPLTLLTLVQTRSKLPFFSDYTHVFTWKDS
jgi:hypothetical protein